MKKLAVVMSNENENTNIEDTIISISKSKFKDVFIQWYDNDKNWDYTQYKQLELCKKLNLNIIFAHLGYKGINNIWLDNEEGSNLLKRYIKDITECHKNNINLVIMHLASGFNPPECNELGLNRLKEITKHAEALNIKIAFENQKSNKHLEYVLSNIKNKNVGLCFDSGHYNVYCINDFNFDLYKNRIFAVHLHDNNGKDDEHLIPKDGTVNWEYVMKKLKENNYTGYLTFESVYSSQYKNISINEFYEKLYTTGNELLELMIET